MFLFEKFFVCFQRAIGITFVVLCEGKIAKVPPNFLHSMNVLLDCVHIEEGISPHIVHTGIVSWLMQTFLVYVGYICISILETGLNSFFHLFTKFSSESAFRLELFIELFADKKTISQSFYCEVIEPKMSVAFLGKGAGIEHQQTCKFHSKPCWSIGILIMLDYVESQFGGNDASIPKTCQIHLLILQLWKFLIKPQDGSKILFLGGLVANVFFHSIRKACAGRTLNVQNIGLFIPIMLVIPEIVGVSDKDELSFGVEPTVQTGAAGAGGYHDDEWVLGGVLLGLGVDIVQCLSGVDIEITSIEGSDEEPSKGQQEGVDPVSLVDCKGGSGEGKQDQPLHDRYYQQSTFQMIWITMLGIVLVAGQVSHQPIPPEIVSVNIGREIKTVPSSVAFTQKFPLLGYDIGGRVYETNKGLVDSTLFDPSYYHASNSCTLYRSQLRLKLLKDHGIEAGWNTESIVTSDQLSSMFAIMSNETYSQSRNKNITRLLVRYQFNRTDLFKTEQNVSVSKLGLNSSEALAIKVVVIADIKRVVLTDGVKLVSVSYSNFSDFQEIPVDVKSSRQYDYKFAESNDLLKFTLCHYSQQEGTGILFIAYKSALRVYNLNSRATKSVLDQELLPPSQSFFTDAIPDHGKYWALTDEGKFVAFRPSADNKYQVDIVELQSKKCTTINKYKSTVHIICEQSDLKYVAEMFLNISFTVPSQALKLNRYYNSIDDARLLFRFGEDYNPKLIISGDNDLMIVPYAVNREVLLESPYLPRETRLRSLGVEMIHSLTAFSNFTHTYAIGVGEYFISLFMLVEEPPEMQCRMRRTEDARQFNILVQLNSSSCVANGDSEQLSSICTYFFPFNIYPSLVEVDAAHHKTIVALVLSLLLVAVIVVVGCGFYCKGNIEKGKMEIKKKIAAIKRKANNKPKPI